MLHKLLKEPEMTAYEAGRDCAINGPDTTNCDFRHFATPEQTKAWEQGKANAERERNAP